MICFKKQVFIFLFLFVFSSASAESVTINFEGLKNGEKVEDFYNGGEGSKGSKSDSNYGITFSAETLAIIDKDDGGSGNFANEKSPGHTIGYFLDSKNIIMNIESGFSGGFSFWYTSTDYDGNVAVYPNPDGKGNVIETIKLTKLGSDNNGGDPNGSYNRWKKMTVSFDGTAKSIVFQGVANKIGFDLITLSPTPPFSGFDISYALDKIIHTPSSSVSDTFTIHFKDVKSEKDKDGNDKEDVSQLCDNYIFKIEDKDKHGANLLKCTLSNNNTIVILDFKIKAIGSRQVYFENAVTSVCKKDDTSNCKPIEIISDFTIYGTAFDVKKDAYSFSNGSWGQAAKGDIPDAEDDPDKITPTNNIAHATKIVSDYLTNVEVKQNLWDSVGYELDIDNNDGWTDVFDWQFYDKTKTSQGLCFGMAFSSIANFNHRTDASVWGVEGDIETQWKQQIDKHWDDNLNRAKSPLKPFNTNNVYSYKNTNIEAMKKIIYYFVSQEYYRDVDDSAWAGDYEFDHDMENEGKRNKLKDLLKNGSPFGLVYYISPKGGHAVVSTQFISYNNRDYWYTYDNTYPNKYGWYLVKDNNDYATKHNNIIYNHNGKAERTIRGIGASISNDTSGVYTGALPAATSNESRLKKKKTSKNIAIKYNFTEHISISLVGGKFKEVIDNSTSQVVPLFTPIDVLEKGKSYSVNTNIFNNKLYLANNKIYKVSIKKEIGFPFMKVYMKVPDENGKINLVSYENIQVDKRDPTLAYFYVGVGNDNKIVKRVGSTDVDPDDDKTYPVAITSIINPQSIVLDKKVKFQWENPKSLVFLETIVIRKKDAKPASIDDGLEVYKGLGESFTDSVVAENTKYYYAFYAVAKNGDKAEARYILVNTYQYTLYGTIEDAQGNPVSDAEVTLKNIDKSTIINVSSSDKSGLFSFNGLTNGTYYLNFSHKLYAFSNQEVKTSLQDKSLEVNVAAIGKPVLVTSVNPLYKVGEQEQIVWNGRHIGDSKLLDISVYREGKWQTIAKGVSFDKHAFTWKVTEPKGEATIKVALQGSADVYAAKEIIIAKGKKVNNPPVAVADTATTLKDTNITIGNVLANDTDADGDTLSVSKADAKSAKDGTVANHNDGTFTYTPKAGFTGSDTFEYTVSDGKGGTDIGTVTITVEKVVVINNPPKAVDDFLTLKENTTATSDDVLANDTDKDGDTLTITAFEAVSTEGGTVANNGNGTFTYTPKKDFKGKDSFTYTISDGKGGTAIGTVDIDVTGECFIATAAFGSYLASDVKVLRHFRDDYLLTNELGKNFVAFYYATSPPVANYIAERDSLRAVTRWALTPVIYSIKYPAGALLFVLLLVGWKKRHLLLSKRLTQA